MSGSRACSFWMASCPLRAVPTTLKSGDPSMISPMTRRMNALSSTTSTVAGLEDTISLLEGPDLQPPVGEMEVDTAPVVEPRVLGHEPDARLLERFLRRQDVALADVDAGAVHELPEHARPAGDLGDDLGVRRHAECAHLGEHERHD